MRYDKFFAYARERHAIYLRRAAGLPRPWTRDEILQKYRFTCVFRELDRTTEWFRRNVRDPLRDRPEVLLATVLFRMLNRVETGEAIFCQKGLWTNGTAFEEFLAEGDARVLKRAVVDYVGKKGPYVTGAYIIAGPPGKPKLDGMLQVVQDFARGAARWDRTGLDVTWRTVARGSPRHDFTLEEVFNWLSRFSYLGHFHSYEIVTDLRHTALLDRAPDVMTWANVGPGARRGLNRIYGRSREKAGRSGWGASIPEEQALKEMRDILEASRNQNFWPQKYGGRSGGVAWSRSILEPCMESAKCWPAWELRDVEHTLCEFDKYERVRTGEGRPRGRFE